MLPHSSLLSPPSSLFLTLLSSSSQLTANDSTYICQHDYKAVLYKNQTYLISENIEDILDYWNKTEKFFFSEGKRECWSQFCSISVTALHAVMMQKVNETVSKDGKDSEILRVFSNSVWDDEKMVDSMKQCWQNRIAAHIEVTAMTATGKVWVSWNTMQITLKINKSLLKHW